MTDAPSQPPTAAPDDAQQPTAPKVYLETFGCQMNVLDSQLVTSQLRALGYQFIDDWQQADVVLYNTCSVREHAEQKVWSRVGKVGRHKETNPDVVLGVIGCMAERDGTDMTRKYPQIDLLCGPGELDKVPQLIDNVARTHAAQRGGKKNAQLALQGNTHRRSQTLSAAEDQLELIDLARSFDPDDQLSAGRSAYVRITRGCNKFCTYCVVPQTRGREVHRPPQHIVDECKKLVDAGVREITLLGQTVNHYHYDHSAAETVNGIEQPQVGSVIAPNKGTGGPSPTFGDNVTSFADLLYRIHEELPALQRLRFVTSLPRDFGDDILKVIRDCPRISRYLHLPVQSGSNRMLKAMNRGYTVEQYRDLVERVRHYIPDAELASDIICGFPGETEEDHQATAELLRFAQCKNCFIFKYSPRPGTAAAKKFTDDVPDDVKKHRNNELLRVQSEVSEQVHQKYVGQTVRVFVESISTKSQKSANTADPSVSLGWEQPQEVTQLAGRTSGDLITMFDGDPALIGDFVDVKIESAKPLALFGTLVSEPAAV
jgi:tRNA-2-methylthio-N6-dimethylallyladenosine synthase